MVPGRVDSQPAYVLHTQPYRESSLLVNVLARDQGRVTLVARGARRPRADLRGRLLPFQPLTLAWFGTKEVKTLHSAEWVGGVPQLSGLALVSGFYLNELVTYLTAVEDPLPELWPIYDEAVRSLATHSCLAAVLRRFELGLISVLGYAPELTVDRCGKAIEVERRYLCQSGVAPDDNITMNVQGTVQLQGATLLAMAHNDFSDPVARREARDLLRLILADLIGQRRLTSRELLAFTSPLSREEYRIEQSIGWRKSERLMEDGEIERNE